MLEDIFGTFPKDNPLNTAKGTSVGAVKARPVPAAKAAPETKQAKPAISISSKPVGTRRRGLPSSGLIKNALAGNAKGKDDADVPEVSPQELYAEKFNDPFTPEAFEVAWQEFLDTLARRPVLRSALSQRPQLQENNVIYIEVGSKLADEEVKKITPELLGYLRRSLRNSYIDLKTKVVRVEHIEGKPMTEGELFQEMKTKNPSLMVLVNTLGLDLDS